MDRIRLSRRQFLVGTAALGVGLTLRFNVDANATEVLSYRDKQDRFPDNDTWLHIGEDNRITIKIPSSEMGQGIHTGLAMIVAEELDANWEQVNIIQAPLSEVFNNPRFGNQMTAGSTSTQSFWQPLRSIGATARLMLIEAAAETWQLSPARIKTQNGFIIANDKSEPYGNFALAAAKLSPSRSPSLKSKKEFRIIGQNIKRLDIPKKVNGSAEFGIDVLRPGMLIAAVAHTPVFKGAVGKINKAEALAVKGVVAIEWVDHGVAVLANDYWSAQKGLKALQPEFKSADVPLTDSQSIFKKIESELDDQGKAELTGGGFQLDLEYRVPFLAHATMEPMNCTAHVQQERCDIWAPTQAQTLAAESAAKITGLSLKQIFIHTTYLGGGFGRRGESDFIAEAVVLSKKMNKPVKVIWSRSEDMQHDFYRPAIISRFQIELDQKGKPVSWHNQFAGPSIFKRILARNIPDWMPLTQIIGDPVAKEGAKHPPYAKGDLTVDFHIVNIPVPVGFWRSVGASYNSFFVESAIDEAAQAMQIDAFEYRRKLLQDHPRLLGVLERVAEKAGWGKSSFKQGLAVQESFGSFVAQVVELSVNDNKEMTLHRIICVADCGTIVNPDQVIAQMQGSIIYGLTAAIFGEITLAEGRVVQSNFHDYPVLRINQCPSIEVHLIDSNAAPGGAGEPGTPPIAPALTNALFVATGERIRELPLWNAGYRLS